ncbi:RHS repeat-associated core domain-containing protein [Massilia genomosp. 1]|uniref:RHS repeat-associated core domain-containing protein n=1 Tax=Massilia genomosp. 1 TaxID=2609280 RepID=UPI001C9E73E5
MAYGDKNNNTVWMVRDKGGTLRGVIDAIGRVLYSLHYTGNLITEVRDYPIAGMALDLPARSVKYKYDAANRLHEVIDARGNSMFYEYDTSNNIIQITDQEGRVEKLAYAGASVAQYTAGDGGVSDYEFDYDDANKQFSTRITGPETASGRRVDDLTHDRSGKLVRRVVNGRVDEEVRYDSGARAETSTNARGFSKRTAYNEFEQVVELTQEDGTTLKRAYSAINLALLETTDELGVKTRFERDAKGNLSRLVEAAGTADERATELQVDEHGFAIKKTVKGRTEANGTVTADAVTLVTFDARGNVETLTEPEQGYFTFVYDRSGNRVSLTDPRKFTSITKYDAMGLVVRHTNALQKSWDSERDKVGNVLVTIDPLKRKKTRRYDAFNRVLESAAGALTSATVAYDPQGFPTVLRDGDGRETLIEYDNFQRMSKTVDGMGNATWFSYQIDDGSAAGALGSLNSPTEIRYPTYVRRQRYDALERPTATTLVERNGATRNLLTGYDPRGQVDSDSNAYGKVGTTQYNRLGQPLVLTDQLKKTTGMAYDVRGNLLELTDARGKVHRFGYDRNNRVVKETLALGQTAHTSYDLAGNVEQYVDFDESKTRFTYDDANRLVQALYYDKGNVLRRTAKYDWSATDRLIGWRNDDAGTQSSAIITYDDADRHTGETVTYPGGFTMGYSYLYSPGGKKVQLTWPDGGVIAYGYSKHGQLDSVEVPGEGRISVNAFNWTVPSKVTLPGGTVQSRKYDDLLSPVQLDVSAPNQQPLLNLASRYGAMQELKEDTRTDANAGLSTVKSYGYDDALRLKTVDSGTGSVLGNDTETFTLDELANRTAHSRIAGVWTYDANNRLKQRGTGADATSYEYDEAGNLILKKEPGGVLTQFVYDLDQRLIAVKDGSQRLIARYGYDAVGRRIWKEQYRHKDGSALAPAVRTYFLYAQEGLIAEATQPVTLNADLSVKADGPVSVTTQYGPRPNSSFTTGALFIKTKNSNGQTTVGYYHHDQRWAPLQATDRAGNIVWAASYDAFGRAQITSPAAGGGQPTIVSNLRLPGQVEDTETGMHYNYHRDYDPQTGRYIESDPIGLEGGVNPYAYVAGNPLGRIDPMGLACPADLKSAGKCIDAADYDPCKDGTDTSKGTSDEQAEKNRGSVDLYPDREAGGRVTKDGKFETAKSEYKYTDDGITTTLLLPRDGQTKDVVHSHPNGENWSAIPGPQDGMDDGYPNYIVRGDVIGVVEKVDGQYQYRLIRGRLTYDQRNAVRRRINDFRDAARKKNPCTCSK